MRRLKGPRPTSLERLRPGCYVKRRFVTGRTTGCRGEHMWVKITKITKSGYEGTLANDPVCFPRSKLHFGSKVRVKKSEVESATCEKAR